MNIGLRLYKCFIRAKLNRGHFSVQQIFDGIKGEEGRAFYRDTALALTRENVATPHYMNCPAYWGGKRCTCGLSAAGTRGASAFLLARTLAWGRVSLEILLLCGSTLSRRVLKREHEPRLSDLRSGIEQTIRQNQLIARCRYSALGFGKTISVLTWSEFRTWRDRLQESQFS